MECELHCHGNKALAVLAEWFDTDTLLSTNELQTTCPVALKYEMWVHRPMTFTVSVIFADLL